MSAFIDRRTCLFAVSSVALLIVGCSSGPDTSDCSATATCAAETPDTGSGPAEASTDGAVAPDAAADHVGDARADAMATDAPADGADAAAEGAPEAGPGGCITNDNCGPGTVCGEDGVCVPGCTETHACPATQSCCTGVCVDTKTNTAHCGGCDIECKAANGTPKCDQGTCAIATCSTGYIDCNKSYDDGCETADPGPPEAPALLKPTIGEYTGSVHAASSLKPTFTWQPVAAPGTCKNTYQIQLDPTCAPGDTQACKFSVVSLDVPDISTASFTPADALAVSTAPPVGRRYYWRVRACDTLKRCSEWSRVRYVNVGQLSDDFNGDGYSDAAIEHAWTKDGHPTVDADICLGGATLNATPDYEVSTGMFGPPSSPFSHYLAHVGDVNADGYADLLLGNTNLGHAWLYLGPPTPAKWAASPDRVISVDAAGVDFGRSVSGAGDVNGDGYDDFLVGAPVVASGGFVAKVYLYFGSGTVTTAPPDPLVFDGLSASFGLAVQGVGDLDQDGYADFIVSDGNGHVYRGRPNAPVVEPMQLAGAALVARAGDINGDGFDDAVFSYAGALQGVWGGPALVPASLQPIIGDLGMISDIVGGRDVDGDGIADLLVGIATTERIVIIRGKRPFPNPTPLGDLTMFLAPTPTSDSSFGRAVGTGDYNGDGLFDVAVSVATNIVDPSRSGGVWLMPANRILSSFDLSKSVKSVPLSTVDPYTYGVRIAH